MKSADNMPSRSSQRKSFKLAILTLATFTSIAMVPDSQARPQYRERSSESDSWGWFFGGRSSRSYRDRDYDNDRHGRHHGGPSGAIPGVAAPKNATSAEGPLFYVVSIGQQRVSVYGNDGLIAKSPVSSGTVGHETPTGIFSVLERDLHHRSNIYSAAPMPYMQRITYSGVALHAGVLPGYAASHGCIRMPYDFAQKLWGMSKGHERVVVTPQDIVPVAFTHPKLPAPRYYSVPGSENTASSQVIRNAIDMTETSRSQTATLAVAVRSDAQPAEAPETSRTINPIDFAKIMHKQASSKLNAADAEIKSAKAAVAMRSQEASAALMEARKAHIALAVAKAKVQGFDARLKSVKDEDAIKALTTQKAEAEALVKEAEGRVASLAADKASKAEAVANAAKASRDAEAAKRDLADAAKTWNRRLDPISIFISRQTGRLYIRQGFIKVFDVPVTIKDRDQPIGTHLYMAMQPEPTASDANPSLRWIVLTMPETGGVRVKPGARSKLHEETVAPVSTDAASKALDRIEMSPEVSELISQMIWTGAGIIISDNGLSRETADNGTDFVILTR